jgi:hypothetical protein
MLHQIKRDSVWFLGVDRLLLLILHVRVETQELLSSVLGIHLTLDAIVSISATANVDLLLRLQHCSNGLMLGRLFSALPNM